MPEDFDCVVVGAGPAGLAAAELLNDAGVDFVVLEAGEEIGGRAKSRPLPDGGFFERGAMLLHGVRIATWEAVIRHGLETDGSYHRDWFGPPAIDDGKVEAGPGVEAYQAAVDASLQTLLAPENAGRSLREVLDETPIDADAKGQMEREFADIMQVTPDRIDATSAGEILLREAPYTGLFELVDGYSELWRRMSAPFVDRIRLEDPVGRIGHSAAGVEVTTAGGETVRAAAAVVTPSVGVLQSGAIEFAPALPQAKTEAIAGLKMGTMIKVGALFRRPIWEELIGDELSFAVPRARYVGFWVLTYPAQNGAPLLTALLGAGSEELTGDPARIEAAVRADLVAAFGEAAVEAELVEILFEDWAANPFVRGYASTVPVGGRHYRAALAAPTPPLFWAGEGCATDGHAETVEAALRTGRTAAVEALHNVRPFKAGRPESRLDWTEAYE